MNLNERQIKALRALKHQQSYLAQYRDSAGWYVWVPKPVEPDYVKAYKARLSLTCRDVWQMVSLGLVTRVNSATMGSADRYLTDAGRELIKSL